jgi:serine/threonine protein kinase
MMITELYRCQIRAGQHDQWDRVRLGKRITHGGEAVLFALEPPAGPQTIAKLYNEKKRGALGRQDLLSMARLAHQYEQVSRADALPFVAWPQGLLFTRREPANADEVFVGVTLPFFKDHVTLKHLIDTKDMRTEVPLASRIRVASLLAAQLAKLHKHGFVFGDFNPENILIAKDYTNVAFVDADGFQHNLGTLYAKTGYTPGYVHPDALQRSTRTAEDDDFVLAIHLFHLLVDGAHPFQSGPNYLPPGWDDNDPPTPHDNLMARRWPFANPNLYQPPGETPAIYAQMALRLRLMFREAFIHARPPTAAKWAKVLPAYRTSIDNWVSWRRLVDVPIRALEARFGTASASWLMWTLHLTGRLLAWLMASSWSLLRACQQRGWPQLKTKLPGWSPYAAAAVLFYTFVTVEFEDDGIVSFTLAHAPAGEQTSAVMSEQARPPVSVPPLPPPTPPRVVHIPLPTRKPLPPGPAAAPEILPWARPQAHQQVPAAQAPRSRPRTDQPFELWPFTITAK